MGSVLPPVQPLTWFLVGFGCAAILLGLPHPEAQAQNPPTPAFGPGPGAKRVPGFPPGPAGAVTLPGQDEAKALEAAGPEELLELGQEAFAANEFDRAALAFETFLSDYGNHLDAVAAVRAIRPLLALSKVGSGKYAEALPQIDAALQDLELPPSLQEELRYFGAISLLQLERLEDAQHALGRFWQEPAHQPQRRVEALLLFAQIYLQQGFPGSAADLLGDQAPRLEEAAPDGYIRARLIELQARLAAGDLDGSLALVRVLHRSMDALDQLITFQVLTLELGDRFLRAGRHHEAITCLQRVQDAETLMTSQRERFDRLATRLDLIRGRPDRRAEAFEIEQKLRRVEREVTQFASIQNYDSALRLRLASAFQALGRYREAALVMEDMLLRLPPDPLIDDATLSLQQCWVEVGRWPMVLETATEYEARFGPAGQNLAMVRYLQAEAMREQERIAEASVVYGSIWEQFPQDPLAPRALFMQGFLYLVQDDTEGALYHFEQVTAQYPDSAVKEDVDYWGGVALSMAKEYEGARHVMRAYLDHYGGGEGEPRYGDEARFRIAAATFSLGEYEAAIDGLEAFLDREPEGALADEAHLLLGDACLAVGKLERGMANYRAIQPRSRQFYEEGWFKVGKALRLSKRYDEMEAHFLEFIDRYPDSPRMPEAVYWVGWRDIEDGRAEDAREVYWATIERFGDHPTLTGMEMLIDGLDAVYESAGDEDGEQALRHRLESVRIAAEAAGADTLALRCRWKRSRLQGEQLPSLGRMGMVGLLPQLDARRHPPRIVVDVAMALFETGHSEIARHLLEETRRWHPRTPERDRIYAGLGRIALAEGNRREALEYFERFERETADPNLLAAIRLQMVDVFEELKQREQAEAKLRAVLEDAELPADTRAEVLLRMGDLLARDGRAEEASAYYERIYIAYGRNPRQVAEAYWRRGQLLDSLGLGGKAVEVYREMVGRQDLEGQPRVRRARNWLNGQRGGASG